MLIFQTEINIDEKKLMYEECQVYGCFLLDSFFFSFLFLFVFLSVSLTISFFFLFERQSF